MHSILIRTWIQKRESRGTNREGKGRSHGYESSARRIVLLRKHRDRARMSSFIVGYLFVVSSTYHPESESIDGWGNLSLTILVQNCILSKLSDILHIHIQFKFLIWNQLMERTVSGSCISRADVHVETQSS
jgi:hypothetical protein